MIRRLLAWIESKRNQPLDFGNHGIIARRADGSLKPLTDDEMWNMMADTDLTAEDYWDDLFARAYYQYGEGIMATQ